MIFMIILKLYIVRIILLVSKKSVEVHYLK